MMRISIEGVQKAQRDNLKMIRTLEPANGLDAAARDAVAYLHRYVVIETHVDSGALRASHRIAREGAALYRIHIDPSAPAFKHNRVRRSVAKGKSGPAVYGPHEHNRGGSHQFYGIPFERQGMRAAQIGADTLIRMLG
jgi:hypothetical protein